MIEILPNYYRKSQVIKDIYDAVQKALDIFNADIIDLDKNLFITTATDFVRHEAEVGLLYSQEFSSEDRRARVIARLRGNGVFTVQALKDLVEVYEPSDVEVREDYSNYIVTLIFPNREGQPANIPEILSAIEELKPAHIQIGTSYVRNPSSSLLICGAIQKSKMINMKPIDVSRCDTVQGNAYIGGIIQSNKNIVLAEE